MKSQVWTNLVGVVNPIIEVQGLFHSGNLQLGDVYDLLEVDYPITVRKIIHLKYEVGMIVLRPQCDKGMPLP